MITLEAIESEVVTCQRCPLAATRHMAVPGVGPSSARVVVIGEAPGAKEDAVGRPFVGAAGRLLSDLFERVGIVREDIFITNTVKCRPPSNRDPLPEERAACRPYLDAQLAVIDPAAILLLGRHALVSVLPDAPSISRCHGTKIEREGRSYFPLYHPAAALYQASLLPTLEEDMRVVAAHLATSPRARVRAVVHRTSPASPEPRSQQQEVDNLAQVEAHTLPLAFSEMKEEE